MRGINTPQTPRGRIKTDEAHIQHSAHAQHPHTLALQLDNDCIGCRKVNDSLASALPQAIIARKELGTALLQIKRYRELMPMFQAFIAESRSLALCPNHFLAMALRRLRRLEEAERALRDAPSEHQAGPHRGVPSQVC
jgi:tetratricopeptide (TPR) repeat protein